MKKVKRNSFILLMICLFLMVGCKKNNVEIMNMSSKTGKYAKDGAYNINVNGSGELDCTREATAIGDLEAEFHYYVTYEKGIMLVLHSVEKVSGDNQDALKQYEDAYNKIKDNYKDIKYYDMDVKREKNSVTNDTVINYTKVDTSKIIKIEGNNIYNDKNKPELKKWLTLGKKTGLTCKGVIN